MRIFFLNFAYLTSEFYFQGPSPKGDWSQPPNIEDLAAKEGTLKDAQNIADKVSERVPPRVPSRVQQFGANFCAFCDGTPRHSAHECPARSVKVSCELSLYLIRTLTFRFLGSSSLFIVPGQTRGVHLPWFEGGSALIVLGIGAGLA